MMQQIDYEVVGLLNAISEVSGRLAKKDKSFKAVSDVTREMARLKSYGYSDDTITTILYTQGHLTCEEYLSVMNL